VIVSYAIKPIADVVAAVGKSQDRPVAKMAEAELEKSPGKDHVNLTLGAIANGVQVRLEVEQGLLRLAGRMAVMAMEPHRTPAAKNSEN
jgi:hypothetical protein